MIPKTIKEVRQILKDENIKRELTRSQQTYKGYIIEPVEYGFFEANNTNDCDASSLRDTTITGLIKQINEL